MIWHFIKRDFKTLKMFWALIALASLVLIPAASFNYAFGLALGYAYFIFSIIPTSAIAGSIGSESI